VTLARHHGGGIILVSLLVALVLSTLPLPEWLRPFRPEWPSLVLIYWCLALPERVGVGVAWLLGIAMDVLSGIVLGQHALGLSVIAYLSLSLHLRIRVFPLWQQSLIVLALLSIKQVLLLWAMGATGHAPATLFYWAPPVIGMLFWPPIFLLLRLLRRRCAIA